MAQPTDGVVIKDAMVFLFAAGVVVPVLRRFKVPTVVGFIFAGLVLGPYGLGQLSEDLGWLSYLTLSDPAAVAPFAELGVLFLLFLIGLELSFQKLWALRKLVFGAGLLQAGLATAVIATIAFSLGFEGPAALTIGLALALSSTAIVMQMLIDQRRAASSGGQAAFGVLLFQDLLVAPILIFVGFAGRENASGLLPLLGEALVQGAAAIAIIVLIGRFVLSRAFGLAARAGGRDFLMAITLFTIVGAAALTFSAGLSLALGAFLAGLLLGETEFKHQTEVDLEPFKGLLLGLFFMTVGMAIDLTTMIALWPQILAGLTGLIALKLIIGFIALRIITGSTGIALQATFPLATAGEFAFVVAAAALTSGVLLPSQVTLISAIAALSMLLIPALDWCGQRVTRALQSPQTHKAKKLEDAASLTGHVIVAGFGRVGEAIGHILIAENAEFVGLDTNATRVAKARAAGWSVYYGNGSHTEILKRTGASGAALFVITIDDAVAALDMVRAIRKLRADAPILVRAQDVDHAKLLMEAGASAVIPDAIEAGLQLAGLALREFGYDGETVRDRLATLRETEYRLAEEASDKPTEPLPQS